MPRLEPAALVRELRYELGRAARRKVERNADPVAHREKLLALITQATGHG